MSLKDLKKRLRTGAAEPPEPPPPHPTFAFPRPPNVHVEVPDQPLGRNERGLVISPPIRRLPGGQITIGGAIDQQELRFALLFWDRLSRPTNNLAEVGLTPEEEFLVQARILSVPMVRFSNGRFSGEDILNAHKLGFLGHDNHEPGRWSLGRGDSSLSFQQDELFENQGVMLSLFEAIPIPDRDVPLQDILEFKAKRLPELLALRHHLERTYQAILSAEDAHRAFATEISALDQAIANQLKVSKESGLRFKLSGLSAKIDYKTVMGAYAGFKAMEGMPLTTALLAGLAAGAAASVNVTPAIERKNKTITPYEYISQIHRDLY